jgi:hypothetical protein
MSAEWIIFLPILGMTAIWGLGYVIVRYEEKLNGHLQR